MFKYLHSTWQFLVSVIRSSFQPVIISIFIDDLFEVI